VAPVAEEAEATEADKEQVPVMATDDYKHEWTLDLPWLASVHPHRNLCVQMQRSPEGNWRAVLVDLVEFRGTGSTEALAIDDLINELERVVAEIRRESSFDALTAWRRHLR
jgi:hypothetical protein